MIAIPEIIPISDLRIKQNEILGRLTSGPIVLTQYSRAAAVLVDPSQWNQLLKDLDDLEDLVAALKAELDLATGKEELVDWEETDEEVGARRGKV